MGKASAQSMNEQNELLLKLKSHFYWKRCQPQPCQLPTIWSLVGTYWHRYNVQLQLDKTFWWALLSTIANNQWLRTYLPNRLLLPLRGLHRLLPGRLCTHAAHYGTCLFFLYDRILHHCLPCLLFLDLHSDKNNKCSFCRLNFRRKQFSTILSTTYIKTTPNVLTYSVCFNSIKRLLKENHMSKVVLFFARFHMQFLKHSPVQYVYIYQHLNPCK